MAGGMFTLTNTYLDNLKRDYQFGGIAVLYMWDMIKDYYEDLEQHPGDTSYGEYELVPDVDLESIWDTYHKNPFGGFDYNTEDVVQWLSAEGLIQFKEEDNA